MTQKPREEIEEEIATLAASSMHTDGQKSGLMLGYIAAILLDIRELLAHPVVTKKD